MIKMTIIDDKAVARYLQKIIDKVFKILPLYEEGSETLDVYIGSLSTELRGFVSVYGSVGLSEYISIISTLEGLQKEVNKTDNKDTIKREIFRTIGTIHKIRGLLGAD